MKRFFTLFLGSFHSPETYAYARYAMPGWGMLYGLGVVALTTLVCVVWFGVVSYNLLLRGEDGQPSLFESTVAQVRAQWPEMKVENNTLTVYAPQPHVINIEGTIFKEHFKSDFITIDTTGKVTPQTMKTPVLITRDSIITEKDSGKRKEIQSIGDVIKADKQPLLIDRQKIDQSARDLVEFVQGSAWKFYLLLMPFMWGIMTGAYFLARAIMLFAVGVVALILGNVGSPRMDYMQAVRLASVAYTPVAVIGTAAFLLTFHPLSTLLAFALGALMVFIALSVTKPEKAA